jgi:hypothetical protein
MLSDNSQNNQNNIEFSDLLDRFDDGCSSVIIYNPSDDSTDILDGFDDDGSPVIIYNPSDDSTNILDRFDDNGSPVIICNPSADSTDILDGFDDDGSPVIICNPSANSTNILDGFDDDYSPVIISDPSADSTNPLDNNSSVISDIINNPSDDSPEFLPNLDDLPEEIFIAFDTEFYQKDLKSGLLCITCYLPQFDKEIYIDSSECHENFNLIEVVLEKLGYQTSQVYRRKVLEEINKYWRVAFPNQSEKDLKTLKTYGDLPDKIAKYGLKLNDLDLYLSKSKGKSRQVKIKFKRFKIKLISFYGFADLFKVFGQCVSDWLWTEEARLQQFRTIKIMGQVRSSCFISSNLNSIPCDFNIELFDTRYVFPPIPASLDNQLIVYGIVNKISINEKIKELYGDVVTEQWCKENMDIVKARYFDIFTQYALHDAKVTWLLHEKLTLQFKQVAEILELQSEMSLGETCGSNIQKILLNLIYKEFNANKDDIKLIDEVISKGTAKYLSKIRGNDFGVMPFLTTGGLLFSRTVNHSVIKGNLLDLDESSCYATVLSSMRLYLGQPRVHTFLNNHPTLKERYEQIKALGIPKDAWYLIVNGRLNKATNTLIYSDLRFKEGFLQNDYKSFSFDDFVNEEKETLTLYDSGKITEPSSHSKILTKEIWMGKVTEATITALSDLPSDWFEEFLNLEVACEIYYDPSLMTYSLAEYKNLVNKLPDDKFQVTDIPTDNLGKMAKWIPTKSNAVLVFDIGKHYQEIKKIRAQYKTAKDPIQEIFKLTLNSTYGIMASLVLKINNPVAANWITSCARAAAWRMTYALNGGAPITDGTMLNNDTVPYGLTFKEIITKYPNYLTEYESSITNNFPKEWKPTHENDFNKIYLEHLQAFIEKSDWLVEMFDYALKGEKNPKTDEKTEYFTFDTYYNTGAGNYVKKGFWGNKQKTRSYQVIPKLSEHLTDWFKTICEKEYKQHFIYVERELLQLASGSEDAMRIVKDADDVHHRNKKIVKMTPELAETIAESGISHPMGISKNIVKLMKLISPSQFMCQDKEQFQVLDRLYQKVKSISKNIVPKDWKYLDKNYLKEFYGMDSRGTIYPVEIRNYDYSAFNFKSPIGLGFEILIFGNRELKTIQDVRSRIQYFLNEYKLAKNGQFQLDAYLNWARTLKNLTDHKYLIHLLAATQIIKLNFEIDYISTLVNSTDQPTYRVVSSLDLTNLKHEKEKI